MIHECRGRKTFLFWVGGFENRNEALKPKSLKHYIIGYTNLKVLTPSLAIMTLFMSVLPSIKRSTLWGRKIARSEFCVRHVCEFGFTKIRSLDWNLFCCCMISKYFGMNDNELIIDLISQTNDICIYKKNLLKNIVPLQRFHEKNGYFHIRSIQFFPI